MIISVSNYPLALTLQRYTESICGKILFHQMKTIIRQERWISVKASFVFTPYKRREKKTELFIYNETIVYVHQIMELICSGTRSADR